MGNRCEVIGSPTDRDLRAVTSPTSPQLTRRLQRCRHVQSNLVAVGRIGDDGVRDRLLLSRRLLRQQVLSVSLRAGRLLAQLLPAGIHQLLSGGFLRHGHRDSRGDHHHRSDLHDHHRPDAGVADVLISAGGEFLSLTFKRPPSREAACFVWTPPSTRLRTGPII